jgi:xylosylprotein 4-beta-galactosyltransferase
LIVLIVGTALISVWSINSNDASNLTSVDTSNSHRFGDVDQSRSKMIFDSDTATDQHLLAVLIPFRHRFKQLLQFVPHVSRFLNSQGVRHRLLVLHQIDGLRFNRAALINAGHSLSAKIGCDYLVMHDVDLLPLNPELLYQYPGDSALHLSPAGLHPKYSYARFVGGVLILSHKTFERLNGMSNRYWGWGQEDDEFYLRLKDHHVPVTTFTVRLGSRFRLECNRSRLNRF